MTGVERPIETDGGVQPRPGAAPGSPPARDMVWIPGGTFRMGSDDHYPEERPVHEVAVDGFWMDEHQVTVIEFRRFVKATGYVTRRRAAARARRLPGRRPGAARAGLARLPGRPAGRSTSTTTGTGGIGCPGRSWRHPEGPGSDLDGRDRHPVVHVAYEDATAYAAWAGKDLPTEAEWEFAARGGLDGAVYTWGDEFAPKGRMMANTWQGEFPWQNLLTDGYAGTSPVKSFPPNGYGLFDMAGNVWEWTTDFYTPTHPEEVVHACCGAVGTAGEPAGDVAGRLVRVGRPGEQFPRMVVKGGSHLCAPNYCLRYRPAARQAQSVETSTAHIGFRCIVRPI